MTETLTILSAHGTVYAYRQGCRCRLCLAENARKSRLLRGKHGGVCVDCGAPTTSKNSMPIKRCRSCAGRQRTFPQGKGEVQTRILEALRDGPKTTSELREHMGSQAGGKALTRLVAYGLVERIGRGVYALPVGPEGTALTIGPADPDSG